MGFRSGIQVRRVGRQVQQDETLSEEGKKLAAQRIIDRYARQAQQHYADAREKAARSVDDAYDFSVPMPDGGAFATSRAKDSSELLAIQGEAARMVQKVTGKSLQAMTKEVSQNPRDEGIREAAGKRAQALREEYDRAMQLGGLEGKVLAHATLRAAEAMGVDCDSVVDEFATTGSAVMCRRLCSYSLCPVRYRPVGTSRRTPTTTTVAGVRSA